MMVFTGGWPAERSGTQPMRQDANVALALLMALLFG
jgi:hypothetical protein